MQAVVSSGLSPALRSAATTELRPTRRSAGAAGRRAVQQPACSSSASSSSPSDDAVPAALPMQRRAALALGIATVSSAPGMSLVNPGRADALGFEKELKPKKISDDAYVPGKPFDFRGEPHEGLKFYDLKKGDGKALEPGATAVLHFDCKFRGLTALSSREARTLGGNRTIAEPLELKYGKLPAEYTKPLKRKTVVGIGAEVRIDPELRELYIVNTVFDGPADKAGLGPQDTIVKINDTDNLAEVPISELGALLVGDIGTTVDLVVKKRGTQGTESITLTRDATAVVPRKREMQVEGGGGLYTGVQSVKPPPAVYVPEALVGMKVGGKRSLILPADVGYADVGEGEIPPGATIKLEVELLEVKGV